MSISNADTQRLKKYIKHNFVVNETTMLNDITIQLTNFIKILHEINNYYSFQWSGKEFGIIVVIALIGGFLQFKQCLVSYQRHYNKKRTN
jgi:ubiquitin C-terminal hydrolase